MNDQELRDLLQAMRNDPVPPDSLARVRQAVSERTKVRRTRWWWTLAAVATACAVILIHSTTAVVSKDAPPGKDAVAVLPKAAPPEPVPTPIPERSHKSPGPVSAAHRPAARPKPPANDVLIRVETPDPDVVILLVPDGQQSRGDGL